MVVRRISDPYRASVSTFFFLAFFFELFFASRYAYASPLFILFIGFLVGSYTRSNILFILLTFAIVIAHVGHATLALAVTAVIAGLDAWYKFRGNNLVNKHAQIRVWNVVLFLIVYGFWYFVQEVRFYGIRLWFNAFIDVLRGGLFELKKIEAVYRLPLEPVYELIVETRIIMVLIATTIPAVLAILQIFKNIRTKMDGDRIILARVAVSYFLFLIPLSIGAIKGIWALRPFHLSMLFSPILVALLFPRKLFRPLIIVTMLFSLIIIYILWIPNLGYIQVPDEKAELIKFASVHIPQHQV